MGVARTEWTRVPGEPSHPAGYGPMAGFAAVTARGAVINARRALMANSKQVPSSTKSARAARKGAQRVRRASNPSLPVRAGELPQRHRK